MSASVTVGFGGIGTWPQTPTPPAFTFAASLAAAPASPLYFAETSLYAGPTTFLSIAWHAVQPYFVSSAIASCACALPAAQRPAATTIAIAFIGAPSGVGQSRKFAQTQYANGTQPAPSSTASS